MMLIFIRQFKKMENSSQWPELGLATGKNGIGIEIQLKRVELWFASHLW